MAGKPPALDTEQRRDCISRFKGGASIHRIAQYYGVHSLTVRRVLVEAGLVAERKPSKVTQMIPEAERLPSIEAVPLPEGLDGDALKAEARRRVLTWQRQTLDACEAISARIVRDAPDVAATAQSLKQLTAARQAMLDQLEQLRRMAGDLMPEDAEVHRVADFDYEDEREDE